MFKDVGGKWVVEYCMLLGVVVVIMFWNFLLVLVVNKFGLVLVMGNMMVLKFVLIMFLIMLLLGELCGVILFVGVVNVICDENDLGVWLIVYFDVVKVVFIGLIVIGKKVLGFLVDMFKWVMLELGGNDVVIVFDDVEFVFVVCKVF